MEQKERFSIRKRRVRLLTVILIFLLLIGSVSIVNASPDQIYNEDELVNVQSIEDNLYLDNLYKLVKESIILEYQNSLSELENIDEDSIAIKSFVYELLGEHDESQDEITIKLLADILVDKLEITYPNYEYYRTVIKDTANRNILKCYSEGLLEIDDKGSIYPDKILTIKEVKEILARLENPLEVARPKYISIVNIPILMYHEINTLPKNGPTGLYVSQDNFKKQLDALQKEGYNTVTMEQVYQHWQNQVPLPEKPIVLSFDDGYASHYNFASVELGKKGMTGTFYIITETLIDGTVRSPKNLKIMHEEGMEIGSHTVTHLDARYSSNTKVSQEYKESKELLENIIGDEIRHFCYPIGGTTNHAIQTLKDLGYVTSVKTTYGKANKGQGLLTLRRIRIDYYDSINGFLNKIK